MRSLAALHIHAMKIHRLLCNDRRRRPTGWIKSTLDYRLTLIDGSRYARFSKSLQFPKVLEILIISNESLSSSSSSFFDFVSPSVHLCRNKLEEYLRSVESFDSLWVDFNSSIFFILNLGWKRFENSSLLDISFYSCLLNLSLNLFRIQESSFPSGRNFRYSIKLVFLAYLIFMEKKKRTYSEIHYFSRGKIISRKITRINMN